MGCLPPNMHLMMLNTVEQVQEYCPDWYIDMTKQALAMVGISGLSGMPAASCSVICVFLCSAFLLTTCVDHASVFSFAIAGPMHSAAHFALCAIHISYLLVVFALSSTCVLLKGCTTAAAPPCTGCSCVLVFLLYQTAALLKLVRCRSAVWPGYGIWVDWSCVPPGFLLCRSCF